MLARMSSFFCFQSGCFFQHNEMHLPARFPPVTAVRKKEVRATGRAEVQSGDVPGPNPGADELTLIDQRQVEEEMARSCFPVNAPSIDPRPNGRDDRLIHLIATRANGGANDGDNPLDSGAKVLPHGFNHFPCDVEGRPTPAGMAIGDNPPFRVQKEDRDTISGPDAQGASGLVRDGRISLGEPWQAPHSLGVRLIQHQYGVPVDLAKTEEPTLFEGKRLRNEIPVSFDIFWKVPLHGAQVQAGKRAGAYPSAAGAKGVGQKIEVRQGNGLNKKHGASSLECEHGS